MLLTKNAISCLSLSLTAGGSGSTRPTPVRCCSATCESFTEILHAALTRPRCVGSVLAPDVKQHGELAVQVLGLIDKL